MRQVHIALAIIALAFLTVSCVSPKDAVRGTGKGITDTVEGAGRGVTDFGMGSAETVKNAAEGTGQLLTGRAGEAGDSGTAAVNAAGGAIKDVVVEPVEGLGKGLKAIDEGMKKATGQDEREMVK